MDESIRKQLTPGTRVKVTQQIAGRDYTWTTATTGEVVGFAQKPTGSWFKHAKNDKLWLDRLKLKKADGEIITLILDEYSVVQIESAGAPTAAPAASATAST
jgi:hypothetical protein